MCVIVNMRVKIQVEECLVGVGIGVKVWIESRANGKPCLVMVILNLVNKCVFIKGEP